MAKREEFDRDDNFDFDPNEILDEEPGSVDVEFDFLEGLPELKKADSANDDLDDILTSDFLSILGMSPASEAEEDPLEEPAEEPAEEVFEEAAEEILEEPEEEVIEEPEEEIQEEFLPPDEDEDVKEFTPAPVPAFDVDPEPDQEIIKSVKEFFPEEEPSAEEPAAPAADADQEKPKAPVRRRKMSRERIIKEVYLPPVILGLTLILLLTFIGSALGRTIKANNAQKESLEASKQEASSALTQEAELLVAEANVLAAGYDYDAAIALLDTFQGDKSQYQVLMDAYNTYTQAKGNVKPIDDAKNIPNLSFHCLIADPARAFIDEEFGKSYNSNYVTIDEFSKILDQLYANGYVLVDFDSFIVETVGEDGKVTFSTQPVYLPEGKKPIMITETLVNYETFSIDSDGDGEADKGGDGFASKLVVKDGKIVNEYVDADGNVLYGAYDLVPILEAFIEAHPDFSYRGARATLAVSGEDGVFGYRIMHSVKEKKGEDYYNQQVEGAKAIAQALRDAGYTIACYTYSNVGYGAISATKIDVDLENWKKEVTPVLGEVPILVYAKASDISADGNYEGGKYNVLKKYGFRYFISSANVPYAEVTVNYVRQTRIMVTGQAMTTSSQTFTNYFNAKDVLNDQRGE